MQLTDEQSCIIDLGGQPDIDIMRVNAFAGTGKTFSMKQLAKTYTKMSPLYIVFNAANKKEAEALKDNEKNTIIKIIEDPNNDPSSIMQSLKETAKIRKAQNADVTICTAHTSKGLEWDHVALGDFKVPEFSSFSKIPRNLVEEVNLMYVASTRGQLTLAKGQHVDQLIDELNGYTVNKKNTLTDKTKSTPSMKIGM